MTEIVDLGALQASLDIEAQDAPRLAEALTHGSFNQTGGRAPTNDRLAFVGDAVIELAIRESRFKAHATASVGELSIWADDDVRNRRLAEVAKGIELGRFLQLGKGAQELRGTESVLATALEAIIGAIFVEKGFPLAASCAVRIIKP